MYGEVIVPWKDEILSLTWQNGLGFRGRRDDFTLAGSFRYKGEGWGMTQDGRHIIMSDGTPQLRIIDPADFREVRRITVSDHGEPVSCLNEQGYVERSEEHTYEIQSLMRHSYADFCL